MWAENCGRGRIRTTVGVSRLIYSQLPLSTRAPAHVCNLAPTTLALNIYFRAIFGVLLIARADDRTRTDNLLFTRQPLCQIELRRRFSAARFLRTAQEYVHAVCDYSISARSVKLPAFENETNL